MSGQWTVGSGQRKRPNLCLLLTAYCPLLTAYCLLLLAACARETPKRNVLLITLDTFRADRVGVLTPNISRIARDGVAFDDAQSPVPLTLPAHASILSGALPLHHGLRNNGAGVFPADRDTLATVFARGGWRTAAFTAAFVLDHRFGLDRGFETYDDEIPRDPNADTSLESERRGDVVVDRALAWLQRSDARPYFAWVHLYDAHAPYVPTYDGEIAFVDKQVGRLLEKVDRANTVIVIVGDHGEALGEHGELTHGLLLYQPTLHVPLIVVAPGVKPYRVKTPVSTIDLASTVATLAGTSMTPQDGRDLAADLRAARDPKANDLYAETEYPLNYGWSPLASLRREQLKLISAPSPELFDLSRDAHEASNVLADNRRAFRDLDSRLADIRKTAVTITGAVDAETRAKLTALGYVAPVSAQRSGPLPDPKTMVPLLRRFENADVATLESLVREDPANPVFRATLAKRLREQGAIARAVALRRETVALLPADADAWFNLGTTLHEAGNRDEAIAALSESTRLDPRRADAYEALGVIRAEEGKFDLAEEALRHAVDIDPHNARAWNNRGNALRGIGRIDDALAAYRTAIELAPRYADPHNGIGVIFVQQRRYPDAVAQFEEALRIAPDFYEAMLNRGISLQESGNLNAAAAQYRDLLTQLPKNERFDAQRDAARTLLRSMQR
ncbi:MAG TPA: sulfatase-like hydrolase/transferase [Thermoanaerobaculia bacterium]|nr:sulfatase-like hydrolase/transferase [Thermoanaerobaculia bacterium]